MLVLAIERFKDRDAKSIGERLKQRGRMLPDGVKHRTSWVDAAVPQCFQLMETADVASLDRWIVEWSDLVDFEVIPVVGSADYWAEIDTA